MILLVVVTWNRLSCVVEIRYRFGIDGLGGEVLKFARERLFCGLLEVAREIILWVVERC